MQISQLSPLKKYAAATCIAELPEGTVDESLENFLKACL